MLQRKSIPMMIVLSFITCGIYGIYWFITLTNDVATVNQNPNLSGGKALVFTIITCGIYGIYWNYTMGKNLYEAGLKSGKHISDNSILFIILGLVGLGIVNYCLIQNDLNNNWAA